MNKYTCLDRDNSYCNFYSFNISKVSDVDLFFSPTISRSRLRNSFSDIKNGVQYCELKKNQCHFENLKYFE